LSGHAHGGQWRIFGRGVFAPHQGLFPKYTSGLHDEKLLISRGASNNVPLIPRFFNPREVLDIHIISK
jgi:predicted MPP superfamily phosphohydrolase